MMLSPFADTGTVTMVMDGAKLKGSGARVTAQYELEHFRAPPGP